jgi:L-ascorbate 6-phosphate lactonase
MRVTFIGQSNLLIQGLHGAVLIDPYLFDTCAERHGPQFRRLRPPGILLDVMPAVDAILITHEHDDHADPASVAAVLSRFPGIPVIGPEPALGALGDSAARGRMREVEQGWVDVAPGMRALATPAAHPLRERTAGGLDRWCGYAIECDGVRAWHAGDTSATDEVLEGARGAGPFRVAFLPMNERNHWRESLGIVGNMSPREALGLADAVGIPEVIPIHWDLFACNGTSRQEVESARVASGCRALVRWIEPGESVEITGRAP